MTETQLSLATFGGGALEERFALELRRVVDSIQDPNTSQKTKRRITVELVFTCSEDRQFAAVEAVVTSKVPSYKPVTAFTLFQERDGELVAIENRASQPGADPRQRPFDVVPLKGR